MMMVHRFVVRRRGLGKQALLMGVFVVIVVVVVFVVMPTMVVRVIGLILAADAELRCRQARTRHALGPDDVRFDGQAAQCAANGLERDAGVDQRPEDHVPGRAGETVEIENPQVLTILPRPALHPSRLDQRVVALIGQDQMIEHFDPHNVSGVHHGRREEQIVGTGRGIA